MCLRDKNCEPKSRCSTPTHKKWEKEVLERFLLRRDRNSNKQQANNQTSFPKRASVVSFTNLNEKPEKQWRDCDVKHRKTSMLQQKNRAFLPALVLIFKVSTIVNALNVTQVHIAYGRDPATSLTISWVSNYSDQFSVGYGEASLFTSKPLSLDDFSSFAMPSDTYRYSLNNNPTGFPTIWGPHWSDPTFNSTFANYTSGFIYNTSLFSLKPDTLYFYKVGDTAVFNFTTAPLPGTLPSDGEGGYRPLTVTVTGDLGQTLDSQLTLQHMIRDTTAAFAVIVGDISYSDCDGTRWDSSLEMLEPLASWKQLMVGPGNHEIEYMSNTDMSFQGFEHRFFMPGIAPPVGLKGGAVFTLDDAVLSLETLLILDTLAQPALCA